MSKPVGRTISTVAAGAVIMLLLAVVLSTAMAAGTFYWTTIRIATNGNLNALTTSDLDHAWGVGASGSNSTIFRSANASAATPTWAEDTITGTYCGGIFALDNTHVWASGGNAGAAPPNTSAILCWNGTTWVMQNAGATAYQLNGATALSDTQAWVCGNGEDGANDRGRILWSNGGAYNSGTAGTAWIDDFTDATTNGSPIKFLSAAGTSVWAVGYENTSNDGKIYKRTGPGAWTLQKTVTGWRLYAVKALDDNHAWAAGRNGTVLYTSDGGTNWLTATTPGTVDLQAITATDMTHVWAGGNSGTIYTLNGSTWRTDTVPAGEPPFTDSVKGAAVGDANTVYLGTGGSTRNRVFRGTPQAIASCNPTTGLQGQTLDVAIVGTGTHFANGTSAATFSGTGITVNSTTVTDPTHASAHITIGAGATPGARDVNVITGTESPNPLSGAFLVKAVYTIQASATAGGTISPAGPIQVTEGNSQTFTITPAAGFHVADVKVDGISVGAVPSYYFGNVTANHSIAATFSDQFPTWFLPEGSTAWGFATQISIENPNNQDLNARVTYLLANGKNKEQMVGLPKMSKTVVSPYDLIGAADFSTTVECVQGKTIAVDRSMYWQIDDSQAAACHNSIGVSGPSNEWFLAEGSSNWGFTTWLLVQNPNDVEANCLCVYMIEGVGPKTVQHVIPAHSRASFNMVDEIGKADASILVLSNVGVVPERSVYTSAIGANGQTMRREGSDSVGVTRPSRDFYLAEGSTAWGFTTYVLIQNPNAVAANATLTFQTGKGPSPEMEVTIPANSRKTVRVNDKFPGMDLSTEVHADVPIVAERSMYWAASDVAGLGTHDSIGTSAAHSTWYLPDGIVSQDDGGTDTYTLVQNPNEHSVKIRVTYLNLGGKDNVVFTDTLPANSRKTYSMADKYTDGFASASILVESLTDGGKIVVERSIYNNSRWGGSDTIGGFSD